MIKLNLQTNGIEQEKLKEYLENNASEMLAEKINNGVRVVKDNKTFINKKDLKGFWKYATDEAKKIAEKGATGTFVDDNTVYGWLIHYFEEDAIEGTLYNEDGTEYKPTIKTPVKTENKAKLPPKNESKQTTLFDLFMNNNEQENNEIETESIEDTEEEITQEEMLEVLENEAKEDTRQIDYETGEIIETNEEIKTFDIEVAKMLYSMLDGKLTMK